MGTTMVSPSYLVEMDPSTNPKCKRKRKRNKIAKNCEEVEIQRMTHIAVERNRRLQMTSHLHALRSLLPPSYVHRGDQASIVGGAIEFVKKMEQLLQSKSLQIRKTIKALDTKLVVEQPSLAAAAKSPVRRSTWHVAEGVRVIDCHVNMKVVCEWRPRLLVNAIAGLEELRLSVLHLNITSSSSLFFLSFSLKIDDDCKVRSAEEIAEAVEHMFNNFMV